MWTDVAGLKAIWDEAFGADDPDRDPFFARAFSPDRCRRIFSENRLAAALYWFDAACGESRLAYLYAVGVGRAFRRRGLCRELMADTRQHLAKLGYDGIVLVPGEPGLRGMYQKMGYETCTTVAEFSCPPGGSPAALRRVAAEEYARLRRQLLPPAGVIQEGVTLDFLASTAELYAGANFLVAVQRQGASLRGLELLGNAQAAPGICRALDAQGGTFRTPGPGREFAMYLPLTPNCPRPEYFGLAFD